MEELNKQLRREVKLLKANTDISFKDMQIYLNLSKTGFYNWKNGVFNLSEDRLKKVQEMINELK